jgi:uncharacterized integral membrane protein
MGMIGYDSSTEDASTRRPSSAMQVEWSGKRVARRARRVRLYLYALFAAAVLVYVVALASSNTRSVRVDWVFASSTVALVWLLLPAAVLGAVLGRLLAATVGGRTRRRRSPTIGSR